MIVDDYNLLKRICYRLREEGNILVLASGVFDILHVGHIRYLNASKKEGNILIVAINSEKSVKSYKKIDVLQPLKERMEIINSINGVDIVTYFDEPTAENIVSIINPHVHSKGTEYNFKTLPEYKYLINKGIKVVFVGDSKTHSSSLIKKKFLE